MAQWQALQKLNSEFQSRVIQLYEKRFLTDIRHHLSVWIESQNWDLAAGDENTARTCFHALMVSLEEQWERSVQENTLLQGPNYSHMKHKLMEAFQNEPLKLAALLSDCLKEERKILASASMAPSLFDPTMEGNWRKLDSIVNELKQRILGVEEERKTLEDLNEKLDFIQKTWQGQVEQYNGLAAQSQAIVEEECLKQASFITKTKQIMLEQVRNILVQTEQTVATLTDVELPMWKLRQQRACIGSPEDVSLDKLQNWFTSVAEVLVGVREQLQKLQEQSKKYNNDSSSLIADPAQMDQFALGLLTKLLRKALVVEKQPAMHNSSSRPLILKTKVRFSVTLRSLVNIPEFKCLLKPVFDKDVEEVKTAHGFRLFDFTCDNSKVLDEDSRAGGLVADFGNMSIKEKKGRVKGSTENHVGVTEELHIIKFVTTVRISGHSCDIEASTLPLVVISSTNQIPSAWATTMWWAMFSPREPVNLSLFAEPPPLSWEQLSLALSWQFLSVGQRPLDADQLCMLRERFVDDADGMVHWNTFSKNGKAWIWIDGILDLIEKHLVELWRDGLIMGFVSRGRTRHLLLKKRAGTFLLRFSESNQDGAITFSWVDQSSGKPLVHAVEPYTKKELESLSLPNIIYHYSLEAQRKRKNPLLFLYPDIHKDKVFGHYYNVSEASAPINLSGYVHRTLVPIPVNPTPPPSPSSELNAMDTDNDMDISASNTQLVEELFSGIQDLPRPSDWMSNQENYQLSSELSPLSPQDNFAAFPLSF